MRWAAAVGLLAGASTGWAYPWREIEILRPTTVAPGEVECENTTLYGANARHSIDDDLDATRRHTLHSTFGCETGLTSWLDIGVDTDLVWPTAEAPDFEAGAVEIRTRLPSLGPFTLGWSSELEMAHLGPSTMELGSRLLIGTQSHGITLYVNPLFEVPLWTSEPIAVHVGTSASLFYTLQGWDLGTDFFADLGQVPNTEAAPREAYLYPFAGTTWQGWHLKAGPGIGLTEFSDPVTLRTFVEREF